MRPETVAVHAGREPDPATGALSPPIHLATTFKHGPAAERVAGFEYAREGNPTQDRFERALAALEGGEAALAFASGMAASAALLSELPRGGQLLIPEDGYSGTRLFAREFLADRDIAVEAVDLGSPEAVAAALSPATRCLWIETPSNPQLKIADIAALGALARRHGALVVVDNTFATPVLQNPLALGADVVMHSTTKYIGGHSDVLGGALVFARRDALHRRVQHRRHLTGAVASPFALWLLLRGLATLPARIAWQCRGARRVAEFLARQPSIATVHWPGLASHPNHAVAVRQMRDFGAMLSIRVRGGRDAALALAGRLKLFTNATSLGGCESLVEHRASLEGANPLTPPDLLRLSIGLEHPDDLVDDLAQALG